MQKLETRTVGLKATLTGLTGHVTTVMWTGKIRVVGEENLVIAFRPPPHFKNASAIAGADCPPPNIFLPISLEYKSFKTRLD